MKILGIETSCDDTSIAVVEDGITILSNIVSSQEAHKAYGGIIPELASRHHLELLDEVLDRSLSRAQTELNEIDLIAVTTEHGLAGSLIAGVAFAKALSAATGIALIAINHIEGHIYSPLMVHSNSVTFPHICLTVSGGHTLLVLNKDGYNNYEILGNTLDDAAGEAFDKVAKILDLGFPGGPVIDKLATNGNPHHYRFTTPMKNQSHYNFSFSGLKTQVVNMVNKLKEDGQPVDAADIAASFQNVVVDTLCTKAMLAAKAYKCPIVTIAGGVSANSQLRRDMAERGVKLGVNVFYPPIPLCTDNAAMIAGLAYHKYLLNGPSSLNVGIDAAASLQTK